MPCPSCPKDAGPGGRGQRRGRQPGRVRADSAAVARATAPRAAPPARRGADAHARAAGGARARHGSQPPPCGRRALAARRRYDTARTTPPGAPTPGRRGATAMKAAVYYETGAPDVFRYEEVPDPTCHPRGVVIGVEAISIEGGDVLHRAGGEMAGRPHIVGYQCGGTILEVGEEVEDRAPGQRVVATMPHGSHAERVSV